VLAFWPLALSWDLCSTIDSTVAQSICLYLFSFKNVEMLFETDFFFALAHFSIPLWMLGFAHQAGIPDRIEFLLSCLAGFLRNLPYQVAGGDERWHLLQVE
jgi:hypothetical protein